MNVDSDSVFDDDVDSNMNDDDDIDDVVVGNG